ncbi:hypothetical protein Vafri_15878 [Volvox africanus]|uniref:Uncharacterized protein n=1 Tax=Volvox africanus TaxID=51714 RepID=A0A8J4BHN5_9CHLO|nr:hypothetical protein Vafri_15878 [Volvox africanus]
MRPASAVSPASALHAEHLLPHSLSNATCRLIQAAPSQGKHSAYITRAGRVTNTSSGLAYKNTLRVAASQVTDANTADSNEPQAAAAKPNFRRRAKLKNSSTSGRERNLQADTATEARRHHVVKQPKSVDVSAGSVEDSDRAPLPTASPAPLTNIRWRRPPRSSQVHPAGADLADASSSSHVDSSSSSSSSNNNNNNNNSLSLDGDSSPHSSSRSSSISVSIRIPELTRIKHATRRPTIKRRRRRAATVSTTPVGLASDMQISQQPTTTEDAATAAATSVAPPPTPPLPTPTPPPTPTPTLLVLNVSMDGDISPHQSPLAEKSEVREEGLSLDLTVPVNPEEPAADTTNIADIANEGGMLRNHDLPPSEAPTEGMETTSGELGTSAGVAAAAAAAAAEEEEQQRQQPSSASVMTTTVAAASRASGAEFRAPEVACGSVSEEAHGDVLMSGAADDGVLVSELEAAASAADPRVKKGEVTAAAAVLPLNILELASRQLTEEVNPALGGPDLPEAVNATSGSETVDAAATDRDGEEPTVLSFAAGSVSPGVAIDAEPSPSGATNGVRQPGSTPGNGEELDDTAVAISVLAAAAAAGAAAAAAGQHPYPYAPRGATRRRTSTWELRPPARRPPRVVPFTGGGGGGLRELQALIDSVREPTIIDLKGAVITLAAAVPSPSPSPSPPSADGAEPQTELSPAPTPVATTALVPSAVYDIPGWSSVAQLAEERAKMLAAGASTLAAGGGASAPPPADGVLLLHRDDVTLANGTLQLPKDCRVVVTGSRVTLRKVEVVDAEASGWGRQATALPATCLQSSALITVISSNNSSLYDTSPWGIFGSVRSSGGDASGPSLELDDCSVIASGRDRDLIRVDGGGGGAPAALTARYSRLRGGANAAVAAHGSTLNLDCCELEGYTASGVVAIGASVRLVGSRLLGLAGSIVGLQAVAGSQVGALGCFLRGHSSNVECLGGSSVDMQGCVLSRSDCRYGLTLHATSAGAASRPPHTHSSPDIPAASGSAGAHATSSTPSSPSSISPSGAADSATSRAGRMRLTDCELGHAIQLGGGELELERCTFVLRRTSVGRTAPPVQATAASAAIYGLYELIEDMKNAMAMSRGGGGFGSAGSSAGGAGDAGAAFAGRVAAAAALRVVGCRVGGGNGEAQAVMMEAEQEACVYVSGSPEVVIRRCGGAGASAAP